MADLTTARQQNRLLTLQVALLREFLALQKSLIAAIDEVPK